MVVKFAPNDRGNPPGKLADAELHFSEGVLDGLKLIGFGVWERRNGTGRNVTFPARQYSVNGERRSFALLRPVMDVACQDRVRDVILAAYEAYEAELAAYDTGAAAVKVAGLCNVCQHYGVDCTCSPARVAAGR
jgi:hypothetical protein